MSILPMAGKDKWERTAVFNDPVSNMRLDLKKAVETAEANQHAMWQMHMDAGD
jgi:hypothetical protein